MIIVIYREEIAEVIEALRKDGRRGEPVLLHFQHILRMMEKKELQAVAVSEHG